MDTSARAGGLCTQPEPHRRCVYSRGVASCSPTARGRKFPITPVTAVTLQGLSRVGVPPLSHFPRRRRRRRVSSAQFSELTAAPGLFSLLLVAFCGIMSHVSSMSEVLFCVPSTPFFWRDTKQIRSGFTFSCTSSSEAREACLSK